MAERHIVVDRLKLGYEGLFNAAELYNVISSWFFERGWDWHERMNQEQVTPKGKQITLILEPWKTISDYYRLRMRIKINMTDITDVEVEHENKQLEVNHGVVRMTVDGYIVSDRKGKWSGKPFFWFISLVMEKYFFRRDYSRFERWIESDVNELYDKVKNYLNVFNYTYQT